MNGPARRFTDKADLDPTAVMSLPSSHPAMVGNRTLFPSTVVTVTDSEPDRLLVSGKNNRKLGDVVTKGAFKGYALYGLSLEERATCPTDCAVRGFCYGNSMQLARRHRIGDANVFYDRLDFELAELTDEHKGLLVRLHVLGDFPSVEYVAFWADALNENERLAVYGYTHRRTKAWDGDEIGDAIQNVKDAHPDRFRIRWSGTVSRPDGAVVINNVPKQPRIDEGLVCPAQTDATACCASCGFCWSAEAKHDTVVFIKHGRHTGEAAAEHERDKIEEITSKFSPVKGLGIKKAPERISPATLPRHGQDNVASTITPSVTGTRAIARIDLPPKLKPNNIVLSAPTVRLVAPADLRVEPAYQRDLSGKSIRLIRKIVENWDWSKFKPPICAETDDGLFVIDGQHTAIAAASHGSIKEIPVLIVSADTVHYRASAFVSHNRDRIALSPFQIFHAEASAQDKDVNAILRIAVETGASVPRSAAAKGYAKPGQLVSVTEVRNVYRNHGGNTLRRLLTIAVAAKQAPIGVTITRALRMILTEPYFSKVAALSDDEIAAAVIRIGDVESEALIMARDAGCGRHRACALLVTDEAGVKLTAEAA